MDHPEKLGRFLLISKIATGGMAEIFLSKLLGVAGFEKDLAVKKIRPQWSSDKDFVSMLIDEAKIAVLLTHPNIIQVYELGREGETYYIAMEYLEGFDLRKVMQKALASHRDVPIHVAMTIICEVLSGLSYAHSKKNTQGQPLWIIHRDISPQNILISHEGSVKLTDFGIAKAASRDHETVAGVLKGKFAYMSPEQANQEHLDQRSDLFSLAIVLYELLAGERLFFRGNDLDTLDRVRQAHIEFSSKAEEKIPKTLQAILRKALSRRREDRYPDAQAFRESLMQFAKENQFALQNEEVAIFLSELFSTTLPSKETSEIKEESTRFLADTTDLLLEDATKTAVMTEIFAQEARFAEATGKTVFFSPVAAVKKQKLLPSQAAIYGLMMLTVSLVFFFLFSKPKALPPKEMAKKELQKIVRPPEVAAPVPPSPSKPETAPYKEESLSEIPLIPSPQGGEEVKKGYLSIQAIPWGTVTIDGHIKKETPVSRLVLNSGPHRVKVLYEPQAAAVTASVQVKTGEETRCMANFRNGKEIRCGL